MIASIMGSDPRFSAADLQKLACFCYDVRESGSPHASGLQLSSLPVGAKLKKTRLPLAGTCDITAPSSSLRVLVFGCDASTAPDDASDPWQLACIDRPAFFVLADRFGYRGVTQLTVVEMDRATLAECGERVLDLGALDYVHDLLVGSFSAGQPRYVSRTSFQEILGNVPGRLTLERLVPCGPHDLDVVEPEGPSLSRRLAEHRQEARLDELEPGCYDTLFDEMDGLWRCRTRRHGNDGHPSLAFHEAQANFHELYRTEVDRRIIERLYSGVLDSLSPMQRDLIADQVWFGSLFLQDFEPLLSDEIDDYLDDMRAAYEDSRSAGRGVAVPSTVFERLSAWFKRRALGDSRACAAEIEETRSRIASPFRYEFSASFDEETASVRLSLYLPQKAIFPLTATSFELVGSGYSSRVLDGSELEDRYTRLACRMGVLTLRLVKSKAPWLRRLELCAWYRADLTEPAATQGAHGPRCLYALSCDEETLARESGAFQRDPFETVRALGARIHRSRDRGLLPVRPFFPPGASLEYRFGFEDFSKGWTKPFPCRCVGRELDEGRLALAIARLEHLMGHGDLEMARRLGTRVEERCRAQWLDCLPPDARAVSCDSAFEELRARDAFGPGSELSVLPRGISRLYVTLANLSLALGCPGDAHDFYERASELDPFSPRPLFGLFELDLNEGEAEPARELADRAFACSYLARDLARAYRCWGELARRDGEYETAVALYSYSLALSRDSDTVEDCMRAISSLRRLVGMGTGAGTDPISRLVVAGYPLHAGAGIREIAAPQVERAFLGGPLPNPSVLAAYLNAGDTPDDPGHALEDLIFCVIGDELDVTGLSRVLYRPIILDEVLPSELLGAESPLVSNRDDEERLGILAIPYLDAGRGLVFDVRATVDLESRAPVHVVGKEERVDLEAGSLEGAHYLRARSDDFPELLLRERSELLAEFYRADAARETTRRVREVDALRSFAEPDEVLAVLVRGGLTPEGVWVRLDCIDDERRLCGTLMSEPHDEFGLHTGDFCRLKVTRDSRVPGSVLASIELGDEN